jgi:diacylglycerol kinase (ATP)
LGWTTTAAFSDDNLGGLKGIIKEWLSATICKYDIWDLEMELYEGGDVRRIKNKQEVIVEDKHIKRSFSNYFSLGIDARIGYSFDRRRTKNKFANLICYGCIGFWKWCRG